MKPKVSICIPAYRQPGLLRTIFDSVFMQSFQDYEVIVTDDSGDDSLEGVIREFNHERRLTYVKNKKRLGSPGNWNFALSLSSGEYVKFLHHDDWFFEKDSLSRFVALLDEDPQIDFAFSSTLVYGPGHQYRYTHSPSDEQLRRLKHNPDILFLGNCVGSPSTTIYRNRLDRRFDPRLKWLVDIDFYMSILREKKKFAFCPEPLVCTTQGAPHQVTRECEGNRQVQVPEYLRVYAKLRKNPLHFCGYLGFMSRLLRSHSVRSRADIMQLGMRESVAASISTMLFLTRLASRLGLGKALMISKSRIISLTSGGPGIPAFFRRRRKPVPAQPSPGEMEKAISFFSNFIGKGDLCYDVGANVGTKTAVFVALGARVVCIEPQKECVRTLKKAYGNNKNVVILKKGLADRAGSLKLMICEDAPTISTMSERWKGEGRFSASYKWNREHRVPVTTLDRIIKKFGMPRFCKIDVEGFEHSVLQGLTRPIPYISFEFSIEFFDDAKKCIAHLLTLGHAQFNFSIGESCEFLFEQWVSPEELYRKLGSIEDELLWGDIYVKFSC